MPRMVIWPKFENYWPEGEDINQRSWHFHNTALMLASQNGHIEDCKPSLGEAGADPNFEQ